MLCGMSAWQNDGEQAISARLIGVVVVIAVLAIVVGLSAGVFIGRSSSPSLPVLASQARDIARSLVADLEPTGALYAAAVPAGTIEDPTAYADAQQRIVRVRSMLASANGVLSALAPGTYGRAVAAIAALATAASVPVTSEDFAVLLARALAELQILSGN